MFSRISRAKFFLRYLIELFNLYTLCLAPLIVLLAVVQVIGKQIELVALFFRRRRLAPLISRNEPKVVIAGAGFSGLCLGIELRKLGIPFVIFESSEQLGGTWNYNKYPGCSCDVPAHLYAFSFEPNYYWSHPFASQSEILEYLVQIAKKYEIAPHIRLGTSIEKAIWNEQTSTWTIKTSKGSIEAPYFVSGIGSLNVPSIPNIEGINDFQGESFHSARWNTSVNLAGKTVAVVGSAASAVQFVPRIVKEAKKVIILQRTPNYVFPKPGFAFPSVVKLAFQYIPLLHRFYRIFLYVRGELLFALLFSSKPSGHSRLSKWAMGAAVKYMFGEKAAFMAPDYPVGCKRTLFSSDWFDALAEKNVEVIPDGLHRVEKHGFVTSKNPSTVIPCDVIIYATGFVPTTFSGIEIRGANSGCLHEGGSNIPTMWGIVSPGFPNFFMLLGPNTVLGHTTVVWMIECQANYITRCIEEMQLKGIKSIDVKQQFTQRWSRDIQQTMKTKVWVAGCRSWYVDKENKGEIHTLWPKHTFLYWLGTLRVNLSEYNLKLA